MLEGGKKDRERKGKRRIWEREKRREREEEGGVREGGREEGEKRIERERERLKIKLEEGENCIIRTASGTSRLLIATYVPQ